MSMPVCVCVQQIRQESLTPTDTGTTYQEQWGLWVPHNTLTLILSLCYILVPSVLSSSSQSFSSSHDNDDWVFFNHKGTDRKRLTEARFLELVCSELNQVTEPIPHQSPWERKIVNLINNLKTLLVSFYYFSCLIIVFFSFSHSLTFYLQLDVSGES